MAQRKIIIRVTKNLAGNFRGFVTGRESVQLGDSDFMAREWIAERLAEIDGSVFDADKSAAEVAA